MRRRECIQTMLAGLLAPVAAQSATPPPGRFRSAICAYSFRDQLKDKAMTYEDLIRLAAELQADGVDMTTYWLPDTNDQTLFALKRLAGVKDSGERVKLAPMNPFERKIVHDAVAAAGLTSESEGEEPNRCVVIIP